MRPPSPLSPLLPLLPAVLLAGPIAVPLRAAPQSEPPRPWRASDLVAQLDVDLAARPAVAFHPDDWVAALGAARVPGVVVACGDERGDAVAALAAACRTHGLSFGVLPRRGDDATADRSFRLRPVADAAGGGDDDDLASHQSLLDAWFAAADRGEPLRVVLAPAGDGRLRDADLAALRDLGEHLRLSFAQDLAQGCHGATRARCGEVWFDGERTVDLVELGEDPAATGAVQSFRVDTWDGERWRPVHHGGAIGTRRLVRIPARAVRGVRWWVERARGEPRIVTFAARRQPVLVAPPVIRRDPAGAVAIEPVGKPVHLHYTLDGSVPDRRSERYLEPFALPRGGTVRAVALPADETAPWLAPRAGPVATAVFGIATQGITVLECSSEQPPGETAAMAFDGDPRTHWHTAYGEHTPAPPHHLALDLGAAATVTGFAFLPRRHGSNGDVAEYAFDVRGATGDWRRVASGTFASRGHEPRVVMLPEPARDVRAVRFVALREVAGRPWAACAELAVLVAGG